MGIIAKIRSAFSSRRNAQKQDGFAQVSQLVTELNSTDESRAKQAAAKLDELLYPDYRQRANGPTLLTVPQAHRISEHHYERLRAARSYEPLITALLSGTDFARAYACVVLGVIKVPGILPHLISLLKHRSAMVRLAATKGLWHLRDVAAAPALIEALQDSEVEVRHSAARTLGWLGSEDALGPLTEMYLSQDKRAKVVALHALGNIGHPQTLPLARAALSDRYRDLRSTAKLVLAHYDQKRRSALQPQRPAD